VGILAKKQGKRRSLNDRKILTVNIELRRCTTADAAALALIGQCTFLETFAGVLRGADIIAHCKKAHSTELYSEWLADPAFRLWLAEVPGGAPVGFMVVAPPDLPLPDVSDSDAEIKRIYLLSKFQGGGVGKRFIAEAVLHAVEREATRLLLGVYAKNDAAIGFYEHSGFSKVGTRQFNVGGNVYDDIIMGRSL
jgi:ribosomal protein S18 acetylase RimI-like enzyme